MAKQTTPTALKILKGEKKNRINLNEPKATLADGVKTNLSLTDEQTIYYNELYERLKTQRIMTDNDVNLLAAYVIEIYHYNECQVQIKKNGRTFKAKTGYESISPYVSMSGQHLKKIIELSGHFGFSPSTRSKISVSAAENVNPFETLRKAK